MYFKKEQSQQLLLMDIHRGSGEAIWQYVCDGKDKVETQEHDAGICVLTLAFPFAII